MTYYVNDTRTMTVTITNAAGTATDPSTSLACKVREPTGTETTYTYGVDAALTKTSTGIYALSTTFTSLGEWTYKWTAVGTSIISLAEEGTIADVITDYLP